jgi:hypothetical protein
MYDRLCFINQINICAPEEQQKPIPIKALFGLAYFRAYAINMPLCIIYKLVNVVYEKTVYEGTIFISENL